MKSEVVDVLYDGTSYEKQICENERREVSYLMLINGNQSPSLIPLTQGRGLENQVVKDEKMKKKTTTVTIVERILARRADTKRMWS